MKRFFHLFKITFLKIKWYFDLLNYARAHKKAVKDYKFLLDLRTKVHKRFIEVERIDSSQQEIERLKIQLKLLDNIIHYVC